MSDELKFVFRSSFRIWVNLFFLLFSFIIVRCWCSNMMSITQLHLLNVNTWIFQLIDELCFFSQKSFNTTSWMIIFIKSKINSSWCCWITTDNDIVFRFILFTNFSSMTNASNAFLLFNRVKNFFLLAKTVDT